MTRVRIGIRGWMVISMSLVLIVSTGCGAMSSSTTRPSDRTTTTVVPPAPTSTSEASGSPQIVVSPEFINGAIPDSRLVLLVSLAASDGGPVTVTGEAPIALVTVDPSTISGDEVAEVTVVPGPTDTETTIDVTVSAAVGDRTTSVTRTVTIEPWEDDREEQGRRILGLFVDELADVHPELGLTHETSFIGTYTAPLLLIVSHYGFYSDDWEVGVSWHIMIPPDDFAELYLRPRTSLTPTRAFRIDSWQTALETGAYTVTEIEPPAEVVR